MSLKTQIHAENGKQEITITRTFDLPVDLLFTAYMEAEIVAQWMNTKVVKLENKKHGGYVFETTDPMGNTHVFSGTIHDLKQNEFIIRTFEMENTPFPPQIEYLTFEALTPDSSLLTMQVIYKSTDVRDQILKLPFAQGINMAHNRIQEIQNTKK